MSSKLLYIITILLSYLSIITTIFNPATVVGADETIADPVELQFADWINQARRNPLAMANSLGMDTDRIRRDFPELEEILTNGMPELIFNNQLYAAAGLHIADMFEKRSYGFESGNSEGNYNGYISASGYIPSKTDESLGMIGFVNFIPVSEAAKKLFENMFMDELTPGRTEKRNILDPDFEEIGISIGQGTMSVEGRNFNAYMTVCTFGRPMLKIELLQYINEFRVNPLQSIASMGMDPERILNALPELYEILTQGLPRLWLNKSLDSAADLHNRDMFENNYYGHDSSDNRTYEDRILDSGYNARVSGESLAMVDGADVESSRKAVETVFRKMLEAELDPLQSKPRMILNPEIEEIGISIEEGYFELDGESKIIYLATCDFASQALQTPLNEVWKSQFIQLINQARFAPLMVAAELGMDLQSIMSEFPDFYETLTIGFQPIVRSDDLSIIAKDRLQALFDTSTEDAINIETIADQDLESENGSLNENFETITFGEAMYPMDAVAAIFKKMFRAALNSTQDTKPNILDPNLKHIGLAFGFDDLKLDGISKKTYVATFNFDSEPLTDTKFIWGIVYKDLDNNNLYSPGEGIGNFPITVESVPIPFVFMNSEVLLTDQTGGFILNAKSGLHRLIARYSDNQTECKLFVLKNGKGILFKIEPNTNDIFAIEY